MAETTSYKSIFKSTALFGFVQIFNIITRAAINKIVAVLLGAEGMGIIGLMNSSLNMLKTGAGLGISQSAVKDIAEANEKNDSDSFSETINVVNRVVLYTSLLGLLITIGLSPWLSEWAFDSNQYILSYILLSVAVAFSIYSEGQLAILKGMRRLRALAKASMAGSAAGLIVAFPFYYIWGNDGIVPSLIAVALASLLFSNYYVRKIKYQRQKLGYRKLFRSANSMIQMGVALMFVNFMGFFFDVIVSAYMTHSGGLEMVGYYHAGTTIIGGYFSIVLTAMSTDYYPRIAAISTDNKRIAQEMNRQSELGLLLLFPLVIAFIFLSKFFIRLLYDSSFEISNQYTDYALIGIILTVVSNNLGMILLAKQAAKIFLISVIVQRVVMIGVYFIMYSYLGLFGLGCAFIANGLLHLGVMIFVLKFNYNIVVSRRTFALLAVVLVVSIFTLLLRLIENQILQYVCGCLVFISSILLSVCYMKYAMKLDIVNFIKSKIHR